LARYVEAKAALLGPTSGSTGLAIAARRLALALCVIDFREFKRNIFLVINHSIVRREIYEK